jgi:hypothetical protein
MASTSEGVTRTRCATTRSIRRARVMAINGSNGALASVSLATVAVKLGEAPMGDELEREATQRQGNSVTTNSRWRLGFSSKGGSPG